MADYTQQAYDVIAQANQASVNSQNDFNRVLGQINQVAERMVAMQREANSPGNGDVWRDLCQANQVLIDGIYQFNDRYAHLF